MPDDPREAPSPSAYREKNPYEPPPRDYKPPSLLAEHKYLALAFTAVLLGFVGFGWYALRHAPARPAPTRALAPPAAPARSSQAPSPAPARSSEAPSPAPASSAAPIYIEALPESDSR